MHGLGFAAALAAVFIGAPASALVQLERLEDAGASGFLAGSLGDGDGFVVQSLPAGPAGPVAQELGFRVAPGGIDGLSGSLRWSVGGAFSLLGVNLDLVDAGGAVIVSDAFAGLSGGFAVSTLAVGPLPEGDYALRLSGAAGARSFAEMAFQAAGPVSATLAPLPATPAADFVLAPSAPTAALDAGTLFAGDSALVAALVEPAAALDHILGFTLGAGADAVEAKASWLPGTGAFDLVGVNIDLLGPDGSVLVSDAFAGVTGGVAISTLAISGLAPGEYRLRVTGAPRGLGDYSLALEIGGTPPAAVPIPAAGALAAAALGALAALRRRRQA